MPVPPELLAVIEQAKQLLSVAILALVIVVVIDGVMNL